MARDNVLLLIDGTDRSSYFKDYDIDDEFESRSGNIGRVTVSSSLASATTLIAGQSVVLSAGETTSTDEYIIRGIINRVSFEEDTGRIVLMVRDRLHQYDKLNVTQTFDKNTGSEAGVISAIWKNIADGGPFGGTVATTDNTGITLNRFRCKRQRRLDRMRVLAQVLGWIQYDDYDKDDDENPITISKKGYSVVATPLVVGSNVVNIPVWESDLEKMRNEVTVEGATEEGEVPQETFSGDNSTTTFTLTYTPATTKVVVGGNELVRGLQGQLSGSYDYYVDTDFKQVIFVTAPASGTNNIVVDYTALLDRPVTVVDPASVSYYGVKQSESYNFKDIVNVEDAELRARKLLDALRDPPLRASINTTVTGIRAGMVIQYSNPVDPTFDGTYVVQKVKKRFSAGYDVLTVGDSDFNIRGVFETLNSRLQLLEEENLTDSELLRILFNPLYSSGVAPRNVSFYSRDVTNSNYLHWSPEEGTGVNGTWDDFNWAPADYDGDLDDMTNFAVVHPNNTYSEFLYDNNFYDSAASSGTITWNTTTKTITMSDASVLVTKVLFKQTAFTYAQFLLGSLTGTVTVEISADGKSTWQSLSEDTRTTLSSSTSAGVYLRITASGSVTITGTTDTFGNKEDPAIKLIMEE